MRILHLGKYAFERTGGKERHVEDLSIAQVRQGAEVTVLSYSDDDGPAARLEQGVRVEPVKVLWSAWSQPVSLEPLGDRDLHAAVFAAPEIEARFREAVPGFSRSVVTLTSECLISRHRTTEFYC